jgi:DNA-directed RNA polymerase subunit RPC12/RpoP
MHARIISYMQRGGRMVGRLISRYRSDAWDSGNSLTRYYEAIYECGYCGGTGKVDDEESETERLIECPECGGCGEVVIYE